LKVKKSLTFKLIDPKLALFIRTFIHKAQFDKTLSGDDQNEIS